VNDTPSPSGREDVQSAGDSEHTAVSADAVESFSRSFRTERANRVARNAVLNAEPKTVGFNRDTEIDNVLKFSHDLESGPITHQKRSGRCWAFAGLNRLRLECMEAMNIESFELSQCFAMFWDKLEKSNYFLENILRTCDRPTDSRLFMWLVDEPIDDAGQWDMFVNLVRKYGVVPKEVYPETKSSSSTRQMNARLRAKLREWAAELRERRADGAEIDDLRERKREMLETTYRILSIHNGEPPESFDWSWRDEDDDFHDAGTCTPREFFDEFVDMDLERYVSLIHCPTDDKPFDRSYTVDYLGNVAEGRPVRYLNVPMETLKGATRRTLEADEAVWFGCDVGKYLHRSKGIIDPESFEFDLLYDTEFGMEKGERVEFGHSQMNHAMLFTGVHLEGGEPVRWKVENSWGEDSGQEGFLVMSDDWFDEYLFQVVVPESMVPDEALVGLDEPPTVLPPWDPMGALAR